MKNFSLLFMLTLVWSCSKFNEDFDLAKITEIETQLPVINISVDEEDFEEMYQRVDEEIEIEGQFSLSRNNELLIENEAVELEIKGSFSTRFSLKTLGVKFEDKYDNRDRSLINPPHVLPHHSIDKIKAIRLRNSGNDFEKTMLKDLSITQLAINAGLDLDLTYGEPALVYVNGEFHGLLNMRTEANTNGMAGLYGVKKSEVTLAKITTHELIKKDGDFARIERLLRAVEQEDIDYLKSEIDLDNFTDYMVFQSYIGNTDWPHNNARFYAINDEKFRFVLFDLDNACRLKINKEPLTIIEDKRFPNVLSDLFFVFYSDNNFKGKFWNRYNSILKSNAVSYEKFESIVDANIAQIQSEIQLNIDKYESPRTMIEWDIELDKLLKLFEEREKAVLDVVL